MEANKGLNCAERRTIYDVTGAPFCVPTSSKQVCCDKMPKCAAVGWVYKLQVFKENCVSLHCFPSSALQQRKHI